MPGGDDEREFLPATAEQIGTIRRLAGETLTGAVGLASREHEFSTPYFRSQFFHLWLARYASPGTIEPLGDLEVEQLQDRSAPEVAGLPDKFRHNHIGFSLSLTSGVRHDGGYLEASTHLHGDEVTYDAWHDSPHAGGTYSAEDQLKLVPRVATEDQLQALSALTGLIAHLDETGSPAPLEQQLTVQIREYFKDFDLGDPGERGPEEETVLDFKSRLLRVLDEHNIGAGFVRRFSGDAGDSSVTAHLAVDTDGQITERFKVQTRIPTEMDGFDFFVVEVAWENGGEISHGHYFDIDVEKRAREREAEDPGFRDSAEYAQLINGAIENRRLQLDEFEEDRAEGFHEFSQADAQRVIHVLEDPGKEVVFGSTS